jgi:hypothetical protein
MILCLLPQVICGLTVAVALGGAYLVFLDTLCDCVVDGFFWLVRTTATLWWAFCTGCILVFQYQCCSALSWAMRRRVGSVSGTQICDTLLLVAGWQAACGGRLVPAAARHALGLSLRALAGVLCLTAAAVAMSILHRACTKWAAGLRERRQHREARRRYLCHREEQRTCTICLESLGRRETHARTTGDGTAGRLAADVCELTCGHSFHRACISPWVERHRSCPICRAPEKVASVR